MLHIFLKAKLHHARVTQVQLEYQGSCAIDQNLLQAVGIFENEQIHIYNLNNGERFITYAIAAPSGSGIISINGAAAHKAQVRDRIIICSYAWLQEHEIATHRPRVLQLDSHNQPLATVLQEESCTV
jgi:aspartate 1-decarboxylase